MVSLSRFAETTIILSNERAIKQASLSGSLSSRSFATLPPTKVDESPSWITDATGTLSREQQQELSGVIRELFEKYGVEMAVLVEPTIPDTRTSSREQAVAVFNAWGIGSEKRKNGILIYMVLDRRRIEIVTGDGLAHEFPDLQVQNALEMRVIPEIHRAGKGAGLVEAANICADVLWKRYRLDPGGMWVFKDEKTSGPSSDLSTVGSSGGGGGYSSSSSRHRFRNAIIAAGLFVAAAFKVKEVKEKYDKEDKTCKHCGFYPMTRVDQRHRDESTMTECNRVEESIGAARFDQYSCPSCGRTGELIRRESPGPYSVCDKCNCRSITSQAVIRTPPSPSHDSVEVTHHECGICRQSSNTLRVIPAPNATGSAPPARRESRRGGGHGGGSSSGGGAGASF